MPDAPERCTCGTFLVENAAFCHRCGRPLRADVIIQQETPAAPPPVPPAAPPAVLPIGFGNPIAVRIAFLMSLGILMTTLVLNLLIVVWCLLAGWGGVLLYRRLTGLRLSIGAGARLGFLTGILAGVSLIVVFALEMLVSGQEMLDQLSAQMVKQNPTFAEVARIPPQSASRSSWRYS